ncbi:hypothetical protein CLF_109553 [Clonorchis sinensis]|uniref:Uncharacterized protein n=1 Tax=Clonorchis sinensis TaxID=79923 RepID=G7YSQ4_CLOSI|nr:hypothetical protein CLF_109553 [Clonorchis sinensis]
MTARQSSMSDSIKSVISDLVRCCGEPYVAAPEVIELLYTHLCSCARQLISGLRSQRLSLENILLAVQNDPLRLARMVDYYRVLDSGYGEDDTLRNLEDDEETYLSMIMLKGNGLKRLMDLSAQLNIQIADEDRALLPRHYAPFVEGRRLRLERIDRKIAQLSVDEYLKFSKMRQSASLLTLVKPSIRLAFCRWIYEQCPDVDSPVDQSVVLTFLLDSVSNDNPIGPNHVVQFLYDGDKPKYFTSLRYSKHLKYSGFSDASLNGQRIAWQKGVKEIVKSPDVFDAVGFQEWAAMPPEGSTRAGILPGCASLDRGSRQTEVGFEPRTFRSVDSRSIHLSHLVPCAWLETLQELAADRYQWISFCRFVDSPIERLEMYAPQNSCDGSSPGPVPYPLSSFHSDLSDISSVSVPIEKPGRTKKALESAAANAVDVDVRRLFHLLRNTRSKIGC